MRTNSIDTVNDVILFNWLKYAGEGLKEIEESTEYDALRNMVQSLYSTAFVPVMSNYFDYVYNRVISPLPPEVNGELIDNYHKQYRELAYKFNVSLGDSLFNRFVFDESPYSKAILLDASGNEFRINDKHEAFDSYGNLISNASEYFVYVPVDAIKKVGEELSLPADAKIIDDLTYVLDSHINEYK